MSNHFLFFQMGCVDPHFQLMLQARSFQNGLFPNFGYQAPVRLGPSVALSLHPLVDEGVLWQHLVFFSTWSSTQALLLPLEFLTMGTAQLLSLGKELFYVVYGHASKELSFCCVLIYQFFYIILWLSTVEDDKLSFIHVISPSNECIY